MARLNKRPVGRTRDVGFQIGVRRTFTLPLEEAWRLVLSENGLEIWLGAISNPDLAEGTQYQLPDGTRGEVRVFSPNSHLRLTWQPVDWPEPSTIQVRVIPRGHKTVLAFHQEHLPDSGVREARRRHFETALTRLQSVIKSEDESS